MDNTEKKPGKEKASFEFHKNNHSNDYNLLVQKLKFKVKEIFSKRIILYLKDNHNY